MIPIVPLPVIPYQDRDPLFGADLRASDADRDVAADILCAAVADGRLTLAELEERLEEVLSARTLREIARRISDLPGPRLSGAVRPAVLPPARSGPGTRWSLLQSLLAPAAAEPRVAVDAREALPLVT
jgi:Domain of unknown function (DUF1707)